MSKIQIQAKLDSGNTVGDGRGKLLSLVLGLVLPALFALLVSHFVRSYSLSPHGTLASSTAFLLLVGSLGLAILLWSGRIPRPSRATVLLLAATGASAIVSMLQSGGVDHSLVRLGLYLATLLLALVAYLTYRDEESVPLNAFFIAIGLVHAPFLWAVVLWIRDLDPPFWQDSLRVADFANVRQYGEFAYLAAVSASAACFCSRRLAVFASILAACALFGIVLTGCRGALLSWILFCLLMVCFSQCRARAALHGGVVLLVSTLSVWYLDQSKILPSPNIFTRIENLQLGREAFASGRLELWYASIQQILARPLFGSGPEGYWLSRCCALDVMQAHNFILQFLLEFGVIGCALGCLALLSVVKSPARAVGAVRRVLSAQQSLVLGGLLVSFLAYASIDQMLYHSLPLLHFALFSGLFAARVARERFDDPVEI